MKKNLKKIDFLLLFLFPVVASVLSLLFRTNFITSTILFFGIPSVYFSIKQPQKVKKIIIFTSIIALPFGGILDYIGTIDQAWYIPHTIFPFRLFSILTIDEFVWAFLITYNLVIFYEYFFEPRKDRQSPQYFKALVEIVCILTLIFAGIYVFNKELLIIPYSYFLMGTLYGVIPMLLFFKRFPKMISKIITAGTYFSLVCFLSEIVGVTLDHWRFTGSNFIGWITFYHVRIPFEEFFFFVVIFGVAFLCYYEFFDDDRK